MEIRTEVTNILNRAKPLKDNMTTTERKAIAELKKNDTIVILITEKGNTTVIMGQVSYERR